MSESRPLYLGPRLRRLRRELGLTQQAMGSDLGISPSYVALLERNQRPLTADLLLRLAKSYRFDLAQFAGDDSEDYARRIADALRDPIFADIDLPPLEVADLATSFPGVSEALLRLYGAYTREQRALAERRDTPDENDPVAEARRFVARERNYFHAIDTAAEDLAAQIARAGGAADWLKERDGTRTRFLPPDVLMGALRRYDRHNGQLLIDDTLDGASRAFQIATHIAYTALRKPITAAFEGESFATPTAAALVRRALASYGAAAIVMPYDRFARAVEARGYDIEALSRQFSTSFEQVAHRLTTLNKPGMLRVPFFFIRVDPAGNVSKRLDGAGFPFAAHGGGCPLWSVHSVFRTPGEIVTQLLELPDGQRYFSIARTVRAGGGSLDRPAVTRAIALACSVEHADKLVYARHGLPDPTPIGVTCRLCNRPACTARSAPPVGREILADDNRRDAAPFGFDDT
jgi:predicted transcriptional regulator/transcriptional regulator with XRE-family HTH domain